MVSNPDGTACSQSQHVRQYEISCFAQLAFNNDLFISLGAFCESPGKPWDGRPCTFNTSTCGGAAQVTPVSFFRIFTLFFFAPFRIAMDVDPGFEFLISNPIS